jgi:dTDP-4-amino-4,6-dideoxygalactose transaminase
MEAATARADEVHGAREELSRRFCDRFGHRFALPTPSGRFGLELLVDAVPAPARRAYVPAYTIEAVPRIFAAHGFEVVFVDVDPTTLSTTAELVRRAYRGPGLLLVTHYFGLAADMDPLVAAASELGLTLLEDVAHAPGASYRGRPVGTFGAGAFFSFETRKPLNGLGGGLVVTDDEAVAARLARAMLDEPGRLRTAARLGMTTLEWLALRRPLFDLTAPLLHRRAHDNPALRLYRAWHARGRNPRFAFADLQAYLVMRQLETLDDDIAHKRAIAAVYDRALPPGAVAPLDTASRPHTYYCYVARHPRAEALGRHLRRRGVDCGLGAEVLPDCAPELGLPGVAEAVASTIELPMYVGLGEAGARRVCAVAATFG